MPLFPIDPDRLGAVATGHVEPVQVWSEVNGRRQPGDQERDEATGLPLWTVHGMVPTDTRPQLIAVRVPARECPAPTPFAPLRFERLVVSARLNRDKALVQYWSAAGMVAEPAGRARQQSDAA